jgi:predicted RNA-binding Zn-ribbon protein involved in translation (DUF1610 family)
VATVIVSTCCNLDREVNVPGQKRWHTHRCPNCGTSWTHIAPTPMTQRKNIEIHTCHKCGMMVWGFEPVLPFSPLLAGIVAGLALAVLLDALA